MGVVSLWGAVKQRFSNTWICYPVQVCSRGFFSCLSASQLLTHLFTPQCGLSHYSLYTFQGLDNFPSLISTKLWWHFYLFIVLNPTFIVSCHQLRLLATPTRLSKPSVFSCRMNPSQMTVRSHAHGHYYITSTLLHHCTECFSMNNTERLGRRGYTDMALGD